MRTWSLIAGLALFSFAWPHLIPGDPTLFLMEGSGTPLLSPTSSPALPLFATHSWHSGLSVFPQLGRALASTLLWCMPALLFAFLAALSSAALGWGSRLARLAALLPLILLAPWISVFTPRLAIIAPVVLLAFHWWGPWHRLIAERLHQTQTNPFVQAGRARGLRGWRFFWRYRWLPIAPACLALISTQAGHILGGSVLLEVLFRKPGLGTLLFEAVLHRDLPLLQWSVLTVTLLAFVSQRVAHGVQRK